MISEAWNTPWKIWNQFYRWLAYPYVRLLFAMNGISWGSNWRFYGIPVIQKYRGSRMIFGPGLQLRSSLRSNPLGTNHPVILATLQVGACLEAGANFAMSGGALCSAESILIGDNVTVGANTSIVDTDFHPKDSLGRRLNPGEGKKAPVVIEDNVFIGMNCLILKGVRIGQGSLVGAGSVVARDVPPLVVVAGNPAVVIRNC